MTDLCSVILMLGILFCAELDCLEWKRLEWPDGERHPSASNSWYCIPLADGRVLIYEMGRLSIFSKHMMLEYRDDQLTERSALALLPDGCVYGRGDALVIIKGGQEHQVIEGFPAASPVLEVGGSLAGMVYNHEGRQNLRFFSRENDKWSIDAKDYPLDSDTRPVIISRAQRQWFIIHNHHMGANFNQRSHIHAYEDGEEIWSSSSEEIPLQHVSILLDGTLLAREVSPEKSGFHSWSFAQGLRPIISFPPSHFPARATPVQVDPPHIMINGMDSDPVIRVINLKGEEVQRFPALSAGYPHVIPLTGKALLTGQGGIVLVDLITGEHYWQRNNNLFLQAGVPRKFGFVEHAGRHVYVQLSIAEGGHYVLSMYDMKGGEIMQNIRIDGDDWSMHVNSNGAVTLSPQGVYVLQK